MKEWFRKYWWFVVALVIIGGLLIWRWTRSPKSKISFGLGTKSDLESLLPDLNTRISNPNQKGFGFYLDVPMTLFVKNKSAREMTLNNIAGTVSYEGQNIFQTKSDSTVLQNVTAKGKTPTPVSDTFQVLVNSKTVKFIKDYLQKKMPRVNYDLTALIRGEIYHFKDSVVINEGTSETTPEQTEPTGDTTGGRG